MHDLRRDARRRTKKTRLLSRTLKGRETTNQRDTSLVNDSGHNGSCQRLLSKTLVNDSCRRLMSTTLAGRRTTNQRDTTLVNDSCQRRNMTRHDITKHDMTSHHSTSHDTATPNTTNTTRRPPSPTAQRHKITPTRPGSTPMAQRIGHVPRPGAAQAPLKNKNPSLRIREKNRAL